MIARVSDDDTHTLNVWTDQPWESTRLLRLSVSRRPRPRVAACFSVSSEGGLTLQGCLGWAVYLTLPWLVWAPRWLIDRHTSASLEYNTDARLPSLYLHLELLRDDMGLHHLGWWRLYDLFAFVLGRWDSDKDVMDSWHGTASLLQPDGSTRVVPIRLDVVRWRVRWKRQWWPDLVQWSAWIDALDEEGWPDPERLGGDHILGQSVRLPSDMAPSEAVSFFEADYRAKVAAMMAWRRSLSVA